MPLTKLQYLRYVRLSSFGVVNSRKSNAILLEAARERSRCPLIVAPALEDVIIWDPRKGERVAVLHGDKHEVSSLALSPDQTSVAAGYEDGSIRLWGLANGDCRITFSGHKSGVTCLQFDCSGTQLVSGAKDTDVIVWDLVNESGLYRLRGHKGNITDCCFMSTHNVLITSSKDTLVKLWDLDTQHCFQTLVGHRSEVWSIALFSSEQRLVTASGDRELRVFAIQPCDVPVAAHVGQKRKSPVGEEEESKEPGGKSPVKCSLLGVLRRQGKERAVEVRTDPSGEFLGCLSADSKLELFQVRSEAALQKLVRKRTRKERRKRRKEGEEEEEVEVTVTCTAEDELPLVHTLTSKAKIRSFDLTMKSNRELLLLLALQNNSLELHLLTPSTHPVTSSLHSAITAPGHRSDIRTVCFSSDDSYIASGSTKLIKIWDRSSQQCIHTMQSGYALSSSFAPGDRHLLVGTKSGELQLFEVPSGTLLEGVSAHDGAVWSVCISPDRRGFVTGSADHSVKFWEFELVSEEEVKTRKRLTVSHIRTLKMSEDVLGVRYSPDQRLLAVALLDCTVKIFFADTLKFFLSLYGHKLPVLSLDISSDSTLMATCSADKNIRVWGLDYGDCHKSIFAHDDSIMCVQFVPKTHLLFSGSKDKTIKCWDADHFEHVMTLEGHQGEVWCLAISHDGDTVVSGSHDFSLRLWGRTQEPLVLSEERENEREALFEEAMAEGGEKVVPGEANKEAVMAGRKTVESMKAAERVLEALQVYREETARLEEHAEECRVAGRELPPPQAHPLIVAMGNPKPERYVMDTLRKVKSSELEECLLVMPFSDVTDFLKLLDIWIQNGWEIELSCRCLFFLLRIHHHQIVTNHTLLPVVDSLRQHTHTRVEGLRDLYGFNLAALQCVKRELEAGASMNS